MNNVNKTMYIPLYGKAYVSKNNLFLQDTKAEEIWEAEKFPLKRKAKSKWLAYYMGIRSAVFDEWTRKSIAENNATVVLHLGCGMDSRALRVGNSDVLWLDVDLPQVIEERKRYYIEGEHYKMLACDVRDGEWLSKIDKAERAVVIMEGVSMYLSLDEIRALFALISEHFDDVALLMDCYTSLGARMSKIKNPVNEVGVRNLYGIDDPVALENDKIKYCMEHEMTPQRYIDELQGREKKIFSRLSAGKRSKRLYRLYEFNFKKGL